MNVCHRVPSVDECESFSHSPHAMIEHESNNVVEIHGVILIQENENIKVITRSPSE
jgi:hypothetical protein